MKITLVPAGDIEIIDGHYHALSADAMFEVRFAGRVPAGIWLRWGYRGGYLDHLVRPVLVYETAKATETDSMAAPLFGKARWIGKIPAGCERVFLKPVDRPGPFSFALDTCRRVPEFTLLPRALRNSPGIAMQAVGAKFILAPKESRQALLYARCGVPLERYGEWRQQHLRDYDPAGFDAPARVIAPENLFHLLVWHHGQSRGALLDSKLATSLLAQHAENWRCTFIGTLPEESRSTPLAHDSRFSFVADPREIALPAGVADRLYLSRLLPGDQLTPFAIDALNAAFKRAGGAALIYADEDTIKGARHSDVQLKPDWSPVFETEGSYIGRAVFWHAPNVFRAGIGLDDDFDDAGWRISARQGLDGTQGPDRSVLHVRRVLLSGEGADKVIVKASALAPARIPGAEIAGEVRRKVSVVIPSKNAYQLIAPCLEGLFRTQTRHQVDVIIVDNGSTDVQVLALYETCKQRDDFSVVEVPGKFNYSRMCNLGAAASRADVLLLLNNDITMPNADWLEPLVAWAVRPEVGAVGARLLFPHGKLQHVGVTLGMGGYAAHQYDNAGLDEAGHLSRLLVPHELSAVTGACIAVERRKFDEVGGFNEIDLPVELNDIDLCLRLAARGYKTIQCPTAELIHHQSASRGFSYRPFSRYGRERDWFKARWGYVIRDDPYFHPAFSLYSTRISLDG